MNTSIKKYIEVESMCDMSKALFSIDDGGDLRIQFCRSEGVEWKSHYVPAKELSRLAKFLIDHQCSEMDKFSVEKRAWQEAIRVSTDRDSIDFTGKD